MIILYTDYTNEFRLLGVYTEQYSLERRFNFRPVERIGSSLESVKEYFSLNPVFFGNIIEAPYSGAESTNATKEKLLFLGKQINDAIQHGEDEKIILVLSRGI